MDLLQLSYFRVVARIGHMTKAAQELYIAQPSLSKTIGRLEDELGVPLFDRQGRQIRLNQFGKTFLEHVDHLFRELEEGQRKVRDMAGLDQGQLTVAAGALRLLPDLLKGFLVEHPHVNFHLVQCSTLEMQHQLESGDIDFCFSYFPMDHPGIQWRPLLTEDIFLVVPPHHRLVGQESVPLREVEQEAVVSVKVGNGLRDLMDDFCQQAGITPHIVYEADEPAAIRDFVEAGLGVAFMPAIARKQMGEHTSTWLHLTHPICQRTIGIAWHEEHYLSQAAHAFRQFVMDYFSRQATSS